MLGYGFVEQKFGGFNMRALFKGELFGDHHAGKIQAGVR